MYYYTLLIVPMCPRRPGGLLYYQLVFALVCPRRGWTQSRWLFVPYVLMLALFIHVGVSPGSGILFWFSPSSRRVSMCLAGVGFNPGGLLSLSCLRLSVYSYQGLASIPVQGFIRFREFRV